MYIEVIFGGIIQEILRSFLHFLSNAKASPASNGEAKNPLEVGNGDQFFFEGFFHQ